MEKDNKDTKSENDTMNTEVEGNFHGESEFESDGPSTSQNPPEDKGRSGRKRSRKPRAKRETKPKSRSRSRRRKNVEEDNDVNPESSTNDPGTDTADSDSNGNNQSRENSAPSTSSASSTGNEQCTEDGDAGNSSLEAGPPNNPNSPSMSNDTATGSEANDAKGRFNNVNRSVTPLKKCSELIPNQKYKILNIARTNTKFGVGIRAEIEDSNSPTGSSFVYLPSRHRNMTDNDLAELNNQARSAESLYLVYKGRVGRADMVELL